MKESKNNKNIENENIDEIVDKKFEEDLTEIKQKLNAEKLSDEFKEKLLNNLENELNKDSSKNEKKIIDFPVITRKLAGICACFIFLCTSCFVFADEIENIFLNFFSNTDKIIERAIENGTYKEIDMDYVEDNGVSIKVDYVIAEEDCLYIAFNVKNEEEFDKIVIEDVAIMNQNEEYIYVKGGMEKGYQINFERKFINKNNVIMLGEILNYNQEIETLKINFNKIYLKNKNKGENKLGNWNIEINL